MENYILLQNKNRTYILLAYPDRYHIITVNKKLDDITEEKLLSGYFSDNAIDEMGLTRETITKTDLRGVAIGGCFAGDAIILYTKNKKLKYELSEDYGLVFVESLFAGVNRFAPPKNNSKKKRKEDWRTPLQNEKVLKYTKVIGYILNTLGVICFFGTSLLGRLSILWSSACLLVMAFSVVLYLIYQPYYFLFGSKIFKEFGYTGKVTHLDGATILPAGALVIRCLDDFCFTNWVSILIGCAAATAIISIVMYLLSKDIRKDGDILILCIFFTALFSFGIVGHVNHLMNFDIGTPTQYTVIDKHHSSGRHSRSSCTVIDQNGTEMEIPIDAKTYRRLIVGESVPVHMETGALGIAYAYLAEDK